MQTHKNWRNILMKRFLTFIFVFVLISPASVFAQNVDQIINEVIKEANGNSQLEKLAHELLDVIGPRLVGTPQMQQAHDWVVDTYTDWGIGAENQQWGVWRGWERGTTHVDLIHPRLVTLEARQLGWSPSAGPKSVEAEVIALPYFKNADAFKAWLPSVKGKFVLLSFKEPTGRPDYNWQEHATNESFAKMRKERDAATLEWISNIGRTSYNTRTIVPVIEEAGAKGIIMSNWSQGFGVNKIFGALTKRIPTIDVGLEDYGLLYRLAEYGDKPKIKVTSQSRELGNVPTFNTIGTIPGKEKPNEYVVLSAHLDSWVGGTGATDNGTGTIIMMEVMRILKKVYPNPKRTILVGHWGSEEQGLNGSRAFVEDNPNIVEGVQAVFNQDNGTGRVVDISGQGFLHAQNYLGSWLTKVPHDIRKHISTDFPGTPANGGSDYAPFVHAGAPAFNLSSLSWSYGTYTWHTNRDTYDKIVFDEVRSNVVLTAILAVMASEDPEKTSRVKSILPINPRTGERITWPSPKSPIRKGGQ